MTHACLFSARSKVKIRFADYPGRSVWQLESGRHVEFGIRYCPYCGQHLGAMEILTAMTTAERDTLASYAEGRRVLEIGSLFGYSTIAMAEVAEVVWAIDPHEGYPASDPRPTHQHFLSNLQAAGVRNKVIPLLTTSDRVMRQLPKGYFDLIFIDCTRGASEILELAAGLAPRWIAVHDYGHQQWTGATEAVDAFLESRARSLRIVDSLAILECAESVALVA